MQRAGRVCHHPTSPNPQHRSDPMSKATLTLKPPADPSKPDAIDWTRTTWRAAYSMARRMIRDRRTTTAATAWGWYLDAARKRFGASGWRVAQLAGRAVFDRRTVTHARA